MDSLMDFLQWSIPTGFLSSLVTWIVSRRKQNNDMLSQLQASINMLSTENRKILDENIILRKENAELKVNQEETNMRISQLVKEVERLRKLLTHRQKKDEKQNQLATTSIGRGRNATQLRNSEAELSTARSSIEPPSSVGFVEYPRGYSSADDSAIGAGASGDTDGGAGDDTTLRGDGGDNSTEPP